MNRSIAKAWVWLLESSVCCRTGSFSLTLVCPGTKLKLIFLSLRTFYWLKTLHSSSSSLSSWAHRLCLPELIISVFLSSSSLSSWAHPLCFPEHALWVTEKVYVGWSLWFQSSHCHGHCCYGCVWMCVCDCVCASMCRGSGTLLKRCLGYSLVCKDKPQTQGVINSQKEGGAMKHNIGLY